MKELKRKKTQKQKQGQKTFEIKIGGAREQYEVSEFCKNLYECHLSAIDIYFRIFLF